MLLGFLLLSLAALAPRAHSQSPFIRQGDVRTQLPEAVLKNRKVWGADFSFGGNATRGNSRTSLINAGVGFFRAWGPHTAYLTGSAMHQMANNKQLQNQGKAALRWDHSIGGPWKFAVFNTHGYNDNLKIDYRVKVGAGPWYDLRWGANRFAFFAALAHIHERFARGARKNTFRASLRQSSRIPISKAADLLTEFYFVPALNDADDHNIDGEIILQAAIWKDILSLRTGWLAEYDSTPAKGVRTTDTFWTAALAVQFGR